MLTDSDVDSSGDDADVDNQGNPSADSEGQREPESASLAGNLEPINSAPAQANDDNDAETLDDLMALQPPPPPLVGDVSEYYANDFAQVSDRLRNVQPMQPFDVPLEICDDFHNVIFPELRHIVTMDGVSKSFVTIQPNDLSNLVQPFEGASFSFVDR